MKLLNPILCLLLSVAAGTSSVVAAEVPADIKKRIESTLAETIPEMTYGDIRETPIKDLYQVTLEAGAFVFVTADGQYLISGELYENARGDLVNLTENARKDVRKALLRQVDISDMIVFSPQGETKAVLNVFTDVDCGYCQKLHQEVPELNSKGVEVRYLAFPRSGPVGPSYMKIATAWCASDPRQALTDIKAGKTVETNVCEDNPVAREFALGEKMGVRGTPALVLNDGTMIPGYQPAEALIELLGVN